MVEERENKTEEIKKKLTDALAVFGVDVSQEEATAEVAKEEPEKELADYALLSDKTQKKIQDLNHRSEELLKKTGMSREALESYVSNPNNFTTEQWTALEKIREASIEIRKATYEELVRKKELHRLNEKKQPGKERRVRQPFGKKKNWISL